MNKDDEIGSWIKRNFLSGNRSYSVLFILFSLMSTYLLPDFFYKIELIIVSEDLSYLGAFFFKDLFLLLLSLLATTFFYVYAPRRKKLITFLRHFGDEEVNRAIRKTILKKFRNRYRLIVLDDGNFKATKPNIIIILILIALIVGIAIFTIQFYSFRTELYEFHSIAVDAMMVSGFNLTGELHRAYLILFPIFLMLVIVFLTIVRLYFLLIKTVSNSKQIDYVLGYAERLKSRVKAPILMASVSTLVKCTNEVWQDVVSRLRPLADITILDISTHTKSIEWELSQFINSHNCIFTARSENDITWAKPYLEKSEHTKNSVVIRYENEKEFQEKLIQEIRVTQNRLPDTVDSEKERSTLPLIWLILANLAFLIVLQLNFNIKLDRDNRAHQKSLTELQDQISIMERKNSCVDSLLIGMHQSLLIESEFSSYQTTWEKFVEVFDYTYDEGFELEFSTLLADYNDGSVFGHFIVEYQMNIEHELGIITEDDCWEQLTTFGEASLYVHMLLVKKYHPDLFP